MWLYNLACVICRIYFFFAYDLHFEGRENVPAEGGFILSSNHRTLLDPVFLALGTRRQIHYMGKAELFKNPILRWAFTTVGSFPVNRGEGDTSALDHSIELIREGKVLGIFPEGTRSKDGTPLRPKSGAAFIARATQANVLPCCVSFADTKLGFRTKVTIRYGKLLPYEALGFVTDSPRELKQATKVLFGETLKLLEVPGNADHGC